MPFNYDATETPEDNFSPLPEGRYRLRIIKTEERKTRNGDTYVNVTLEAENGRKLFHNVTFIPYGKAGYGMAIHWLKCIGEPYEGVIDIDPSKWNGILYADVIIEEYQGKKKNALTPVLPEDAQDKAVTADHGIEDEAVTGVPF